MRRAFINQFRYTHYEEPLEIHFQRQGVKIPKSKIAPTRQTGGQAMRIEENLFEGDANHRITDSIRKWYNTPLDEQEKEYARTLFYTAEKIRRMNKFIGEYFHGGYSHIREQEEPEQKEDKNKQQQALTFARIFQNIRLSTLSTLIPIKTFIDNKIRELTRQFEESAFTDDPNMLLTLSRMEDRIRMFRQIKQDIDTIERALDVTILRTYRRAFISEKDIETTYNTLKDLSIKTSLLSSPEHRLLIEKYLSEDKHLQLIASTFPLKRAPKETENPEIKFYDFKSIHQDDTIISLYNPANNQILINTWQIETVAMHHQTSIESAIGWIIANSLALHYAHKQLIPEEYQKHVAQTVSQEKRKTTKPFLFPTIAIHFGEYIAPIYLDKHLNELPHWQINENEEYILVYAPSENLRRQTNPNQFDKILDEELIIGLPQEEQQKMKANIEKQDLKLFSHAKSLFDLILAPNNGLLNLQQRLALRSASQEKPTRIPMEDIETILMSLDYLSKVIKQNSGSIPEYTAATFISLAEIIMANLIQPWHALAETQYATDQTDFNPETREKIQNIIERTQAIIQQAASPYPKLTRILVEKDIVSNTNTLKTLVKRHLVLLDEEYLGRLIDEALETSLPYHPAAAKIASIFLSNISDESVLDAASIIYQKTVKKKDIRKTGLYKAIQSAAMFHLTEVLREREELTFLYSFLVAPYHIFGDSVYRLAILTTLLHIYGDEETANRLFKIVSDYARISNNSILSQYRNVKEMSQAFIRHFRYKLYEEPLEIFFRRQGVEIPNLPDNAKQESLVQRLRRWMGL